MLSPEEMKAPVCFIKNRRILRYLLLRTEELWCFLLRNKAAMVCLMKKQRSCGCSMPPWKLRSASRGVYFHRRCYNVLVVAKASVIQPGRPRASVGLGPTPLL